MNNPAPIKQTIFDETFQQDGYNRELIQAVDNYRLRYKIHIDFYDFQSRASVEVWSTADQRWNQIHHIPGKRLILHDRFRGSSKEDPRPDLFQEALCELEDVALRVLGISG